jgi:iduronate 2-sulfatase
MYPSGGCPGCGGYNDPPSWEMYHIPSSNTVYPWNITDGPSWMSLNETEYPESLHPDAQTADYIISQMAAAGAAGRNFFLAPGFYKPHLPFIFPSHYLTQYENVSTISPRANPPSPPMAQDSWTGWSELRNYEDIAALIVADNLTEVLKTPCNVMPREKALQLRRAYFSAVSFNDHQIGRVLAALDATGFAQNTTVVIFGDHGWQLGDQGDWCKHENFEDTVRAPLLIRSPAHPQAAGAFISTAFTQHIDIFPTLLDLAGIPRTGDLLDLEGVSLVPILENPSIGAVRSPNAAYSQYPHDSVACPGIDCSWPRAMGYTIRTAEYRYTAWVPYNNDTYVPDFTCQTCHPAIELELYNHTGDVGSNWYEFEDSNIVAMPRTAGIVANLSALLQAGPNLLQPKRLQ